MKKSFILMLFVFLMVALPLWANPPGELIEKANQAYTSGEFSHAIELYEQVIESGMVAPELYYNLGNAYFRDNQTGAAILNYERALRLKPNDENIIHNLEVANRYIVDLIEPVPLIFYERWWRNFILLQPIDHWAISGIIGTVLFLSMLAIYFLSRKTTIRKLSFFVSLFLLLFTGLAFTAAHLQYKRFFLTREAIVFVPRTTAKSAPSESNSDLFVIHEGSKVRITRELGDWYEVRLANGNVGWVKMSAIEVI